MIDLRIEDLFNGLSGEKELRYPADSPNHHGRGEDADVSKVVYDSRNLTPGGRGEMFACVKGERSDGRDFARAAVEAGCAALLCERAIDGEWVKVPQIITANARASMGEAAAVLLGRPSERMIMIGLTGTNGKTTTSFVTRSIMRASGLVAGMIGTIVYDDGRSEREASRTTPEGPDVQAVLAAMVRNGARCCVM
ncbi:MAG: Mur ligase domain-containing protein, partial [Synergistaceae bacterium]|nr:Mur ligase domain-containing protein [Synergistaceae bacterium]